MVPNPLLANLAQCNLLVKIGKVFNFTSEAFVRVPRNNKYSLNNKINNIINEEKKVWVSLIALVCNCLEIKIYEFEIKWCVGTRTTAVVSSFKIIKLRCSIFLSPRNKIGSFKLLIQHLFAIRGLQPRRLYCSICNATILKNKPFKYDRTFIGLQILPFVLRDCKSRFL